MPQRMQPVRVEERLLVHLHHQRGGRPASLRRGRPEPQDQVSGSLAAQHRSQLAARTGHMTPPTTRKVGNKQSTQFDCFCLGLVLIGSPSARKKKRILHIFFFSLFQSNNTELCLLAAAITPELFFPICEYWFVLYVQESDLCSETGADHRPGL